MPKKLFVLFLMLILLLSGIAIQHWLSTMADQGQSQLQRVDDDELYAAVEEDHRILEPVRPLPLLRQDIDETLQKRIDLGKRLFNDTRLSGSGKLSCASCHNLSLGGADPRGASFDTSGKPLRRNAPTVYNVAFSANQFWDGRAQTLQQQAHEVITSALEMNGEWPSILQRLREDSELIAAFSIYPQGISQQTVVDALALFERTLITPNSPFDRYLRGDEAALTTTQKQGYELFKRLGCISCHQGRNLGGNLFQYFGVYASRDQLAMYEEQDKGRYEVTGEQEDMLLFKVPSLRNIALTAPYFHDGSRTTLEQAVQDMGQLQLGKRLSELQTDQLVQFLQSLTGELQESTP